MRRPRRSDGKTAPTARINIADGVDEITLHSSFHSSVGISPCARPSSLPCQSSAHRSSVCRSPVVASSSRRNKQKKITRLGHYVERGTKKLSISTRKKRGKGNSIGGWTTETYFCGPACRARAFLRPSLSFFRRSLCLDQVEILSTVFLHHSFD